MAKIKKAGVKSYTDARGNNGTATQDMSETDNQTAISQPTSRPSSRRETLDNHFNVVELYSSAPVNTVKQALTRYNLTYNDQHQFLACNSCKIGISPQSNALSTHLRTHDFGIRYKSLTLDAKFLLRHVQLDPVPEVCASLVGSKPLDCLGEISPGYKCAGCTFSTVGPAILAAHVKAQHLSPDDIYRIDEWIVEGEIQMAFPPKKYVWVVRGKKTKSSPASVQVQPNAVLSQPKALKVSPKKSKKAEVIVKKKVVVDSESEDPVPKRMTIRMTQTPQLSPTKSPRKKTKKRVFSDALDDEVFDGSPQNTSSGRFVHKPDRLLDTVVFKGTSPKHVKIEQFSNYKSQETPVKPVHQEHPVKHAAQKDVPITKSNPPVKPKKNSPTKPIQKENQFYSVENKLVKQTKLYMVLNAADDAEAVIFPIDLEVHGRPLSPKETTHLDRLTLFFASALGARKKEDACAKYIGVKEKDGFEFAMTVELVDWPLKLFYDFKYATTTLQPMDKFKCIVHVS
jgi:hypothetical protein